MLHGLKKPVTTPELTSRDGEATTPWDSELLSKERMAEWSKREATQQYLSQVALNDPELGFELFDEFLASKDPNKRYYASRMATTLFRASELEGNKAILLLLDDPDVEVRTPVELLLTTAPLTGTVRDVRDQKLQS